MCADNRNFAVERRMILGSASKMEKERGEHLGLGHTIRQGMDIVQGRSDQTGQYVRRILRAGTTYIHYTARRIVH